MQYEALADKNLQHFDAWAFTFGETVTAIELAPDGTGYRAKTRFAKFYNLPELMMMFRQVADIQTADMLNLPVPKANYHNIAVKPTEIQKELVASLSERAEKVRNKMVDSSVDNMLLITNDGRKLALDQRLTNEMLPDDPDSKVVFHSFRHASITYKLKWNGGDMKSVQGDSGHSRMDMVAEVYSHIIDEDRRFNAQKFEEQFYQTKGLRNVEEGQTVPMPSFSSATELKRNETTETEDHNIYAVPFRGGTLINIKNDGSFTTQSLIRHRGQSTITVCKEK